jgi:hypothetical protein
MLTFALSAEMPLQAIFNFQKAENQKARKSNFQRIG